MRPLITAAMALSLMGPVGAEIATAAEAPERDLQISRNKSRPVREAPAEYFTGSVQVEMLFTPDASTRASAGSVTFSPGARANWHTHPLGQTLVVTAGVGRVRRWGGPIEEIARATWCASRRASSTGMAPRPIAR